MVMQIGLTSPTDHELRPRITVVGCGGAGGNAVNNMIRANLQGVEFVVTNTDNQALSHNLAPRRIQLGASLTRGLGAGAKPEVGRAAAEECVEEILQQLDGSNMVFITAGMGGGTGTGAAPVIARAARERGILTVGVVTKPFQFEGVHRMRLAENGIQDLQQYVDTLIVIPNQNLFRLANERTTFADAFKMADDVLHAGVRGVTDLMMKPGLINLDFADIRTVMSEMGKALMGTGEGTGDRRALDAAEAAISNPLLDDASMKGARAVLINITGGLDLALFEVDEAANRIREEVDPDSNIIFGATFDEDLEGRIRVSVVATGIDTEVAAAPRRPQIMLVTDAINRPAIPNVPPRPNAGVQSPPNNGPSFGIASTANAAPIPHPAPSQTYPSPLRSQPPPMTASVTPPSPAAPMMDGGFIPPRPVEATIEPAVTQRLAPASSADPMLSQPATHGNAALAMQPSSSISPAQTPAQTKEKARAPSLFERFTSPLSTTRRDPTPEAPNPGPSITLSGNPNAPSPPRTSEEDLLEIPAFLRRQAN